MQQQVKFTPGTQKQRTISEIVDHHLALIEGNCETPFEYFAVLKVLEKKSKSAQESVLTEAIMDAESYLEQGESESRGVKFTVAHLSDFVVNEPSDNYNKLVKEMADAVATLNDIKDELGVEEDLLLERGKAERKLNGKKQLRINKF
ncbi:MAG: hypothetical protein ACRDBG_22620 [Waterburya sp.]